MHAVFCYTGNQSNKPKPASNGITLT